MTTDAELVEPEAIQDTLRQAGSSGVVSDSFDKAERIWRLLHPEESRALVEVVSP